MSAKDYMEKDYYAVLGVAKDADADLIKKEYRKLARKFHPDHNKEADAENKFKEVSEAYDVLSDQKKRAEYDEIRSYAASGGPRFGTPGSSGFPSGFGNAGAQYDINLEDLFGNSGGGGGGGFDFGGIFGDVLNRSRGGRNRSNRARKGSDVAASVTLSFDEALNGVTLPLKMSQEGPCPTCLGTGAKPGTFPRECDACHGVGTVNRNVGGFGVAEPCLKCHGTGSVVDDPDPACGGTGRAASATTIQARVPAGVKNGATIRLKGKGQPGESGGAAGDLLIEVTVKADSVFTREGDNLRVTLPVRYDEAALGAQVPVPVPGGGTVTVKLAAGSQNGSTLRVRGRGVARKDGTKGDLLATIDIVVPPKLDDDARAAVESLRTAFDGSDPRAAMIAANKKR